MNRRLISLPRSSQMFLLAIFLPTFPAAAARAQESLSELKELRLEIQRLREEIAELKKEIRAGKEAAPPASTEASRQASLAASVELLQTQVAEQAQTKVESNSRFPVKLFGAIVASSFFNSGETNWIDAPNLAQPKTSLPAGSFGMSLRQSRIGASVEGPAVGRWKTSGVIAADFFGGVAAFDTGTVMGLPRLLYGFLRMETERTALEFGQDQMIFAPNNPTSLVAESFPELYRSGNLYLRAPQIRVEHTLAANRSGTLQFSGGILAPVAGDAGSSGGFIHLPGAGERSRQPALQARLGWRSRGDERHGFELGVSGHQGRLRFAPGAKESWGVAMDFDARAGRAGLGGEWFVGQNIAAFGAALGQFARSAGGFIEGRLAATRQLNLNAGFGTDRLFDLGTQQTPLPVNMTRNNSVFANVIYQFTPELATSLEYRWLATERAPAGGNRNNHLNLTFVYRY